MKTLAMFPGQGSQSVGMGKELLEQFPEVAQTFEEAEDSAKIQIRKLCFEGPEEELQMTANQQPCILTLSVAVWRVLKAETGLTPDYYAGHSLGEYSALVASEKLKLSEAVRLVRKRGEAMQQAVPPGVGAMAAVMNCDADILDKRCKEVQLTVDGSVEIVNFNSPKQLIVSGHKKSVDKLCEIIGAEAGVRTTILPVSAPFHSRLMEPAKAAMAPLIQGSGLTETPGKIIANLTGAVESSYSKDMLIEQIDSPVLWTQTLDSSFEEGCERYIEIGPGKVLFSLARRSLPKGMKLINTTDIRKAIVDINN